MKTCQICKEDEQQVASALAMRSSKPKRPTEEKKEDEPFGNAVKITR